MQEPFRLNEKLQPYIKLHGSSDWIDLSKGEPLLVMGGNKTATIDRYAILRWNHDQFKMALSKADTRLMVIGYGFRDKHINGHIQAVSDSGRLRLFIIDPCGVDVLQNATETYGQHSRARTLSKCLQPHLIGASRRRLRGEIFGGDPVEHGKVMRFFGDGEMMGYPPVK